MAIVTLAGIPGPGTSQTKSEALTTQFAPYNTAVTIRIAVLDDYIGCAAEFGDWSGVGDDAEVTFYREAIPPEQLADQLRDYEIIAITQQRARLTRDVLEKLPNLKLIVTNQRSTTVVDHDYRRERGIMLCGAPAEPKAPSSDAARPGGISSTGEMAWALLFAITKRIGIEDRVIRGGGWQTGFPLPLNGKTLGLAGLGNIGAMMVGPAKAFGMNVIAWSENLTEERTEQFGVRLVSKETLLAESDVLAIFLVLSDRTRGLFQHADLALMKPTAFLVNISRGPIVDEEALIEALANHRIAGAGLDVYDTEPLPAHHPLRTMDNVVLMPHLGYVTEAGFRNSFVRMAGDIAAFIKGAPTNVIE